MTKPQINVTPLIDVLLVLLIIFMVVTPLKPSAFEARVPDERRDLPVDTHPDTLVVVVNTDLTLRLNRDDLAATVDDPQTLIETLRKVFELRTQNIVFAEDTTGNSAPRIQKAVFIKAPRGLDYGSVAKVVDAVKTAGANPVSLQIDDLE
jgi:biopolymer transport protein ExbD